jgi:hypothetical protein
MRAPLNAGRFAHDTNGGTLAAKIEVAANNFADLDRRLSQVDVAIKETAKRGKTIAALSAIEGQRKARAGLVDERKREAGTLLAALQAERRVMLGWSESRPRSGWARPRSRSAAPRWPPRAGRAPAPPLSPVMEWSDHLAFAPAGAPPELLGKMMV